MKQKRKKRKNVEGGVLNRHHLYRNVSTTKPSFYFLSLSFSQDLRYSITKKIWAAKWRMEEVEKKEETGRAAKQVNSRDGVGRALGWPCWYPWISVGVLGTDGGHSVHDHFIPCVVHRDAFYFSLYPTHYCIFFLSYLFILLGRRPLFVPRRVGWLAVRLVGR